MSDGNGFWKALGNFANAAAAAADASRRQQRIQIPGGGRDGGAPAAGKGKRIVFNGFSGAGYPAASSCRCSGKR